MKRLMNLLVRSADSKTAKLSKKMKSRRSMHALESRIVFDGAAVAAVDAIAQASSDAAIHPDAVAPVASARTEIVFVESNVADYQTLLNGIDPAAEVHVLDASQDGLAQIADILGGRSGIDAIHIVSHGSEGSVGLGALNLSAQNLGDHATDLATIGGALDANADILLYGCSVAAGSDGAALVDALAQATRADIAASTDPSGSTTQGGDWTLETQTGQIDTALAISETALAGYDHLLASIGSQTIPNFDGRPDADLTATITENGFSFAYAAGVDTIWGQSGMGSAGSVAINLGGANGTETLTITNSTPGTTFKFTSFYFNGDGFGHGVITITGKLGGATVGSQTINTGLDSAASGGTQGSGAAIAAGVQTMGANSNSTTLWNVDTIVITSNNYGFNTSYFDNFVFDPAVVPGPAAPSTPDMTVGTDSGSLATDNITNDTTPDFTITGTTNNSTTVTLFNDANGNGAVDGGESLGTAAGNGGSVTITASALAGGAYNIKSIQTDATGTSSASSALAITIDATAPSVPSAPDMTAGTDSGVNTDNLTSDTTPTFSGTAEADSTVTLYDTDGTTVLGSATATGGNWTITSSALSAGAHTLTAKATDAAGNVSVASTGLAITIDVTAPNAPSTPDMTAGTDSGVNTDNLTSDTTPTFSGTAEADSTVTLYDTDGTTVLGSATATGGNWTITSSALSAGAHTLTAKAADAAGNVSVASTGLAITIDATAPNAPSAPDMTAGTDSGVNTDNLTNDTTPTFSGTAEANSTVTLYDTDGTTVLGSATATGGNWTITSSALSAGAHTLTAKAADAAGNVSVASTGLAITIDATAPNAPSAPDMTAGTDSGVNTDNLTNDTTPTFSGTAEANSTVTLYDTDGTTVLGSATATGGNWTITSSALSAGAHTLTAKAADAAGNVSVASTGLAITIDATAPNAPSAPDMTAGTDSGSSSTDNLTSDTTPTFSGTAEADSTVTLYDTDGTTVLGTATATGGNWSITSSVLSAGAHTVTAKATDAAGNVSVASTGLAITIDAAASAPTGLDLATASDSGSSTTDNITSTTTPVINGGGAESGATVTLYDSDGITALGTATADGSGNWSITSSVLTAGTHTLTAKQTDTAGNVSVASSSLSVTVDTTAPTISSVSIPNATMKVGDTVTVTITVNDDGGTTYTLGSSTIDGFVLSNLTRSNSTTYTADFTVTEGGTDVAAGSNIPVSLVLTDPAGNSNTAYVTAIAQAGDAVNAHSPTDIALGNNSVSVVSGANTVVGALSSTDGSSGESFTYSLVAGAGDTNNASFSISGGNLLANNPGALTAGNNYSVRVQTIDAAGNSYQEALTINAVSNNAPVIDLNGGGAGTGNTVTLANAAAGLTAATATAGDSELDLSNWNGGSLSVQRVTSGGVVDGSVNDVFAFTAGGSFGATGTIARGVDSSGTLVATAGSTQFATWTYTSATGKLVVTFDADAGSALVQDVVRHIGYSNTTPYGDATIRFGLSDGSTTSNADVTVTSNVIYVDQTAFDAEGDAADGFNLAEALAIANDGDSVLIQDGTYLGQFVATTAVTIDAVNGAGHVTLQAPANASLVAASVPSLKGTTTPRYAILDLETSTAGSGTVTVKNLTIDGNYEGFTQTGPKTGTSTSYFIGIATLDTNAVIDGVTIQHMAAGPFDGVFTQNGWGIGFGIVAEGGATLPSGGSATGGAAAPNVTVTIQNSTIDTFQKTGIVAWGPNLNAIITNNHISGSGIYGTSGQSGMQIGSVGARTNTTATVNGNTIGNLGAPDSLVAGGFGATGILTVTSGTVEAYNNTITRSAGASANSLTGIDVNYSSAAANVHDNTLNGMSVGVQVTEPLTSAVHTISSNSLSTSGGNPVVFFYDPVWDAGGETIANFGPGTAIRVVAENFSSGTLSVGDGAGVAANSIEILVSGGTTTLYIDTSVAKGSATPPLIITLNGIYQEGNFRLDGEYIHYQSAVTFSNLTLSADTGTSSTDFITATAAQTIGATLSAGLGAGDIVYGSLDNGATWTDVTSQVSGTTLTWNGVTLSGSNTLQLKVTDSAGNDGTVKSLAYVLDQAASAITFSAVSLSADTGSSNTDFITATAAQTISATLSAGLGAGDIVYGSLDNGATWTDVTSQVSGTTLTWNGVTLSGSNTLQLKVTDSAGNDGMVKSQAYAVDNSAAPPSLALAADTGSGAVDAITSNGAVNVSGLEAGATWQYSLNGGATWAAGAGSSIPLSGNGEKSVTVRQTDAAGNVSSASTALVFTLDGAIATPTLVLASDTGSSAVDAITTNGTVNVSGLEAGATWQYSLDGGATWTAGSGSSIPLSGNGGKSVTVRQTDVAGNVSSASSALVFTLDGAIAVPTVALAADTGSSAVDGITTNGTVNVSGLEAGATWQYSLDGGVTWTAGVGSSITLTGDGDKTVSVRQTDAAGNVSISSALAFRLDSSASTVVFGGLALSADTGTVGDFNTSTAAQTVSATLSAPLAAGDTVWGSLDNGATWGDITNKVAGTTLNWDGVTLVGSNTLQIKVVDSAGNSVVLVSKSYALESVPPLPPIPPSPPPVPLPPPPPPAPPLPPVPTPPIVAPVVVPPPPPPPPPVIPISVLPIPDLPPGTIPQSSLVVDHGIGNLSIGAGETFTYIIPKDAFLTSAGDAQLSFQATLANGAPLPSWLRFNPETGTFSGVVPEGESGDLRIRVKAVDSKGNEAVTTFTIKSGVAARGNGNRPENGNQRENNAPRPGQGQQQRGAASLSGQELLSMLGVPGFSLVPEAGEAVADEAVQSEAEARAMQLSAQLQREAQRFGQASEATLRHLAAAERARQGA